MEGGREVGRERGQEEGGWREREERASTSGWRGRGRSRFPAEAESPMQDLIPGI